jgi:hypothetical protein
VLEGPRGQTRRSKRSLRDPVQGLCMEKCSSNWQQLSRQAIASKEVVDSPPESPRISMRR